MEYRTEHLINPSEFKNETHEWILKNYLNRLRYAFI